MALTLTKAREKAKILGIDPRGSKAEITKRLQLYENQPANPSTSEDDKHSEDSSQPCDAIVACTIDPSADDTMITDASQKLKDMVDRGLHVETIRNGVFVGNHQGLEYASCRMRLDEITDRITALERDNKDLKSDNTDLKSDNKNLNSRITDLELSTQGFYKLRSRFLSTYKRDRLGTASSADYQTIGEGNVFAHAGNALRDAELYTRGERTDFPTYKSLYGLHPGIVTMISYPPTIRVLNRHATLLVSGSSIPNNKSFTDFIAALENSGYASGYLEEEHSRLADAYWSFWKHHG